MISPNYLIRLYDRNVQIVKMQTEGLTQAESLVQLPFRANCMNWVVGHVVTNRHNVLKLLDGEYPMEAERVKRYTRESEAVHGEEEGVLALGELAALLEKAQAQIAERLAVITPEALERQTAFFGNRSMSVAEWLLFFFFHDAYHVGQTEILRQAAGKDDKVI
jgi:uncharacterized damage-inducible protein DinB